MHGQRQECGAVVAALEDASMEDNGSPTMDVYLAYGAVPADIAVRHFPAVIDAARIGSLFVNAAPACHEHRARPVVFAWKDIVAFVVPRTLYPWQGRVIVVDRAALAITPFHDIPVATACVA
jgi:hypothetical protein